MLSFILSLCVVKLKESLRSFSLSPDTIFQTLVGFWASKALMTLQLSLGAVYKGITIMTSNEIDARQMNEDDLEEVDRIMKLAFGTFIGLPQPVINVKSNRKREKIVRPQSCIPFPVHTTASIDR
jgi:hypothetical protein